MNEATGDADDEDSKAYRLDLALPSLDAGPEAQYARSVLLQTLQLDLDELPDNQREVFVARKRYAVLSLRTRLQAVSSPGTSSPLGSMASWSATPESRRLPAEDFH